MTFLLIFLGGGLGAIARYALALLIPHTEGKIPYAILVSNLLGCFLIGIAYGAIKSHHPQWAYPLIITGFLGGFTTFSSFALDTHNHITGGFHGVALVYIAITVIGGLSLTYLGIKLTA